MTKRTREPTIHDHAKALERELLTLDDRITRVQGTLRDLKNKRAELITASNPAVLKCVEETRRIVAEAEGRDVPEPLTSKGDGRKIVGVE